MVQSTLVWRNLVQRVLLEPAQPLPDDLVAEIFSAYTIEDILKLLSGNLNDEELVASSLKALRRVLESVAGGELLSTTRNHAIEACISTSPQVREFAAMHLGAGMQRGSNEEADPTVATSLLHLLEDQEMRVGAAAEKALLALAERPGGLRMLLPPDLRGGAEGAGGPGEQLRELSRSSCAVTRMRALTLQAVLVARAEEGEEKEAASEMASAADPLAFLAAAQMVQEVAESCEPATCRVLAEALLPLLLPHLQPESAGAKPMIARASLTAAAALVRGIAQRSSGGSPPHAHADLATRSFLAACAAALAGPHDEPEAGAAALEEAALAALALLGACPAGAELISEHSGQLLERVSRRGLSLEGPEPLRMAALHALASVAGAERMGPGGTHGQAMLSEAAEACLQRSVMGANAGFAGVMAEYLQRPFPPVRRMVYRVLAGLGLRPWAACQIVLHQQLFARLASSDSESGLQGCQWRYSCLLSLQSAAVLEMERLQLSTISEADGNSCPWIVAGAAPLMEAVRRGPFGTGAVAGRPHEHLVAVRSR